MNASEIVTNMQDKIFPKVCSGKWWVFWENDNGLMPMFLEYLSLKPLYKNKMTEKNVQRYDGHGLPGLFLIRKSFVPKEVIATFMEAAGNIEIAASFRSLPDNTFLVTLGTPEDKNLLALSQGMCEACAIWLKEKKEKGAI